MPSLLQAIGARCLATQRRRRVEGFDSECTESPALRLACGADEPKRIRDRPQPHAPSSTHQPPATTPRQKSTRAARPARRHRSVARRGQHVRASWSSRAAAKQRPSPPLALALLARGFPPYGEPWLDPRAFSAQTAQGFARRRSINEVFSWSYHPTVTRASSRTNGDCQIPMHR